MKWISFVYENGYKVVYPWHKEDESGTVLQGTVTPSHYILPLHTILTLYTILPLHSTLSLHTTFTGPAVWYEGQMEPQIGSFSSYVYFLFCPVLLYRDRYPRQPTNYWKAFGYFIQVRVQFILFSVKMTYAHMKTMFHSTVLFCHQVLFHAPMVSGFPVNSHTCIHMQYLMSQSSIVIDKIFALLNLLILNLNFIYYLCGASPRWGLLCNMM